MSEPSDAIDRIAADVIDSIVVVRRELGVGLLESAYKEALEIELVERGHEVSREHRVALGYRGRALKASYVIDLLVDGIVVEAKAVPELHPVFFAQTLTYLSAVRAPIGILVNFHAVPLREGIHRLIRKS